MSPDGNLMAADVTLGAAFKAGTPKALFAAPVHVGDEAADIGFRWDAAAAGDGFSSTRPQQRRSR